MEPSLRLQRRGPPSEPTTKKEEEEDEDVADFYQYIPRRKGDFPLVDYQPPNDPPSATQYDILDRIFEDDLPIYVLRPESHTDELELSWQEHSEGLGASPEAHEDVDGRRGLVDVVPGSRSASARQLPVTARSTPSDSSLAYDPDDSTLILVGLEEILSYVTQRALERYETYRFENPQPDDFPIIVPGSRQSSEVQVIEREQRAQEREGIKVAKRRGRPPKKKSKLGMSVVDENPDAAFFMEGSLPSRRRRMDSEVPPQQFPVVAEMNDDADVVPSVEEAASDLNMLNMTDTLRSIEGPLSTKPKKRIPAASNKSKSIASSSARNTPGLVDKQLSRDSSAGHVAPKRRGRPPKSLAKQLHLSSLRPSPSLPARRNPQLLEADGYHNRSATSSDSSPNLNTQSTVETYLNAMSKAKEAKKLPSIPARHQSPRKQAPAPSTKAGGKQRALRADSVKLVEEPVIEVSSGHVDDSDEENYEISHIIGHDDSHGERFYLVAWKGFDASQATYLTSSELKNAKGLLKKYLSDLMEVEVD